MSNTRGQWGQTNSEYLLAKHSWLPVGKPLMVVDWSEVARVMLAEQIRRMA